jgi:hypothetical protein
MALTATERVVSAIRLLQTLWPHHDGPAHIVLADFNLRDSDLEWVINEIDRGERYTDHHLPGDAIFEATRALMAYLLAVPEESREAWANNDPYPDLYGSPCRASRSG